MKNSKFPHVDYNIDKFMLYLHKRTESLIAIELSEIERLDNLIINFDGIENIPDNELVKGIKLVYYSDKKIYSTQAGLTKNYRINELSYYFTKR